MTGPSPISTSPDETIAAIATAAGPAAIGIVRLSGPAARTIAARLVDQPLPDRGFVVARLHHPADGHLIDEVIALVMPGPRSYTGEDVVELQGHGGSIATSSVLAATLAAGARLAEPGEFTLRACLNGRLDLARAEAVLAVINARTPQALAAASATLDGRLSRPAATLRSACLDLLAALTASIDFPEDDVPTPVVGPPLEALLADLDALCASAGQGRLLADGARVVLHGKPNVGKSSLLNALLRTDRAIVTPIPGTTRDTLDAVAAIDGIPLLLIDTAGVAATNDQVEQIGVDRARSAARAADLVLLVFDTSRPLTAEDHDLIAAADAGRTIGVLNKTDLPSAWDECTVPFPRVAVSAATGNGLDQLERQLTRHLGAVIGADAISVTERQATALERTRRHLTDAASAAAAGLAADFVTIDLGLAVTALGEITGDNADDELLDVIFSRFCIGK